MAAAWIEAHRSLDAGIPLSETEMKKVERSLNRFYFGIGAFTVAALVAISAWGISNAPEREAAFIKQCEAAGYVMKKNSFAMRCVEP